MGTNVVKLCIQKPKFKLLAVSMGHLSVLTVQGVGLDALWGALCHEGHRHNRPHGGATRHSRRQTPERVDSGRL